MLFQATLDVDMGKTPTKARERAVSGLLTCFSRQFPQISYELVTTPMLLNAQALVLRGRRIVKLFGGLAFHPRLDLNALAFALLHETGHHLADGSRLPWNPFLACECQADQWALRNGALSTPMRIDFNRALADLDAVLKAQVDLGQRKTDVAFQSHDECWGSDWEKRRKSLLANATLALDHACPLRELSEPPH